MYRLDRMRKQYEKLTAAQGYIIGFEMNGIVYGVEFDKIPRRYTKVQKECSKAGGGYGLYINVNTKKTKMQLMKKAFEVGTIEELENGIYNKGVMFEKMIYEFYGQKFRGKDNVPFHKAGDITINGKEIQIKFLKARICYDKTLKKLSQGAWQIAPSVV